MSARTEQMKWAVQLQMREHAPGTLDFDDPSRWGDVSTDEALGAFSCAISAGSHDERVAAADTLGWMLDARAASPLVRALADPDADVRRAATRAFSSFLPGPEWTVEPLLTALNDSDSGVRCYAVGALIRHRSRPDVANALRLALHDPVDMVRRHARIALRGAYEFANHVARLSHDVNSEL